MQLNKQISDSVNGIPFSVRLVKCAMMRMDILFQQMPVLNHAKTKAGNFPAFYLYAVEQY